ncbi:MAG: hypothetical protein QXD04_02995 [Candidatus Bathyarchaeia archaeon]
MEVMKEVAEKVQLPAESIKKLEEAVKALKLEFPPLPRMQMARGLYLYPPRLQYHQNPF